MKSLQGNIALALGLLLILLCAPAIAQEKKSRPEPPGPDLEPKQTVDAEKEPSAEPESESETEPKRTGNWYIRQSPQMLKALEPVSKSSLGTTVRVLADLKNKDDQVEEGQVALGAVVDTEGYIVTKASQLFAKTDSLKIEINGKKVPAKLFGIDQRSDLAMLKIEPAGLELKAIEWQNQTPEVGYLLATPDANAETIGFGVLSVASREERDNRGFMGVNLEDPGDGNKGSVVIRVTPKSPAAYAGLRIGDLILGVNGEEVKDTQELIKKVSSRKVGETVKIKLRRDSEEIEKSVKLGDRSLLGLLRLNPQETIAGNELSQRRTGFDRVIQHDTVLKPEEMGGPLLDLDGRAVGLNIAKNGRVSTYALPLSVLQPAISDLRAGKLAPEIVHKPRIEQLAALIKEKEEMIAKAGLKESAEAARKRFEEAQKAFEEAEKEYERAQKALEEAGREKYKADEKQKELHTDNRRASQELEKAQEEIEELKKEKEQLEKTFK